MIFWFLCRNLGSTAAISSFAILLPHRVILDGPGTAIGTAISLCESGSWWTHRFRLLSDSCGTRFG